MGEDGLAEFLAPGVTIVAVVGRSTKGVGPQAQRSFFLKTEADTTRVHKQGQSFLATCKVAEKRPRKPTSQPATFKPRKEVQEVRVAESRREQAKPENGTFAQRVSGKRKNEGLNENAMGTAISGASLVENTAPTQTQQQTQPLQQTPALQRAQPLAAPSVLSPQQQQQLVQQQQELAQLQQLQQWQQGQQVQPTPPTPQPTLSDIMSMMERMFDAKVGPFAEQVDWLLGEVEYIKARQEDSDNEELPAEDAGAQEQGLAAFSGTTAGEEGTESYGAAARPVRSCRRASKDGGVRENPYEKK